uniref:Rho-GAP domain-containing protein n=1 Tax=Globodera pallida TaxID=36090 RepID=A0A183BNH3_GLOPA
MQLLLQLPSENFHLLAFVFRNVQLVIQKESANKMSLPAMGVLLQAMLDLPRNVVKLFITNAAEPTTEGGPSSAVQLFDSVDIGP